MTGRPRPLVLVAAGGLAREAMSAVARSDRFAVVGLLDDAPERLGAVVGSATIVGRTVDAGRFPDAQFLVCAGHGSVRERIVRRLADVGVGDDRYATVIDPSAVVPEGSRVGAGSIVLAHVALTAAVTIGRHVVLMPQVVLTHDDRVGDYATVCAGVAVGGSVEIGRGAYLGMNSSVRQDVRVGRRATLGMGAVLLTDLPDGRTWAGVPARDLSSVGTRTTAVPSGGQVGGLEAVVAS